MKRHRFDLESTHLQDLDRLSRLVTGVCLVYVWLIALGSWVVKSGQRHLVDRKDRRDKSYSRLGWNAVWLEVNLSDYDSYPMDQSGRWQEIGLRLPIPG